MKRIKEIDWTRVLQERLQDARLPLEDDFASFTDAPVRPSGPLRSPSGLDPEPPSPWRWAQAGVVAAAVIAGVLFLTRASGPSDIPGSPGHVPESLLVQNADAASPSAAIPSPTGEPPAPEEMAPRPDAESGGGEIPDQVRDDYEGVRKDYEEARDDDIATPPADTSPPSADITPSFADITPSFADLIGEPPARQRPRMALRVQASALSGSNRDVPLSAGLPDYLGVPVYSSTNPSDSDEHPLPLPISFGVCGELTLSRHWALSLGLDYSRRAGYNPDSPLLAPYTLHYLGVPLEVRYHFWPENRFRLFVGGGLKAEKCLLAKGGEPLPDPFLFSANVLAGADIRILPGVRVYLTPVLSQYLNRSAYLNNWDAKPLFSLRAGLAFDLN